VKGAQKEPERLWRKGFVKEISFKSGMLVIDGESEDCYESNSFTVFLHTAVHQDTCHKFYGSWSWSLVSVR